ncbi:hypothetical protein ACQZ48_22410 [Agrobacterium sp. 22-209-1]
MFKNFQWWNPLSWLGSILNSIGAFLHLLGVSFGLIPPPPTDGHENIQTTDVVTAEQDARRQQEATDDINANMTPAQVVHAYCTASEESRKTVNLAPLSMEQQDWLMRLSDADLVMLGESGETACRRSVEARKLLVNRAKLRPADVETAPKILKIPGAAPIVDEMSEDEKREYHREFFADRHAELFLSSGAPNTNPKFTPPSATLH